MGAPGGVGTAEVAGGKGGATGRADGAVRTRRKDRISQAWPSSETCRSSFRSSVNGRPFESVATTSSTTTSAPDGKLEGGS